MDGSEIVDGSEFRSVVASFKLSAPPCNVGRSNGGIAGGFEPLMVLGSKPSSFDELVAELEELLVGRDGALGTANPKPGASLLPCSLSTELVPGASVFAVASVLRGAESLPRSDGANMGRVEDELDRLGSDGMVGGPELGMAGIVGGEASSAELSMPALGVVDTAGLAMGGGDGGENVGRGVDANFANGSAFGAFDVEPAVGWNPAGPETSATSSSGLTKFSSEVCSSVFSPFKAT